MNNNEFQSTERRKPAAIPFLTIESDAELQARLSAAARDAHLALAAAIETDRLMMRLGVGRMA